MSSLAQKRRLDTLIGGPITAVLNLLARLLGATLSRDHSLRTPPRRILLIKLIGQGSVVQETNMIRALRREHPEATICFLCFPEVKPLATRLEDVDEVIVLDESSYLRLAWTVLRFVGRSWSLRPDLVVDLEVFSKFSTILATLTLARDRAGYYLSTTRFRRGLCTHLVYYNRMRHVQEAYRQLGRALGVEPEVGQPVMPRVSREEHAEAARLLEEAALGGRKLLLVNVNAGELMLERRWPAESFARVIEAFARREDVLVVMTGSPGERDYTESVRALLPEDLRERVVNSAGRTSYGGFLALLSRADVVLTNDSGPMNLGWAMGAATVTLWGPGLPVSYRPLTGRHHVLVAETYCSPCIYFVDELPCAGANVCMQRIRVAEVVAAVADLLEVEVAAPEEEEPQAPAYAATEGYLVRVSAKGERGR